MLRLLNMWRFARFGTIVQFKEREKHPWSVTFSKVAGLLKVTLLHGCFSRF